MSGPRGEVSWFKSTQPPTSYEFKGSRMKKLASGVFGWSREERCTNRYGKFEFRTEPYDGGVVADVSYDVDAMEALVGNKVRLVARVTATRKSGHCGDLYLGIKPSTPKLGEEIELGVGTLLIEAGDDTDCRIGLKPSDGREEFWIDPRILYRLHDQTVELLAEKTDAEFSPAPKIETPKEEPSAIFMEDGYFQVKGVLPNERLGIEMPFEKLGEGLFQSRDPRVGEKLGVFKK